LGMGIVCEFIEIRGNDFANNIVFSDKISFELYRFNVNASASDT